MERSSLIAGDEAFMDLAIEEARRSTSEDGQVHPKVGAVVVRDGSVLGSAHRGQFGIGDHAEYIVLEHILKDQELAGSTVYTTLEPCTTRSHPKVPCALRLVEHGVRRVVIGTLDPDVRIRGMGVGALRDAGIAVDFFAEPYMVRVEELNRDYIRLKRGSERVRADSEWIASVCSRRLDEWYRVVNATYWSKNSGRAATDVFTHMVEVVGGISGLASSKRKATIDPARHLSKALAWWMSLCGIVGVRSPESMVWAKFPGMCPYCMRSPHDNDECTEIKRTNATPRWRELADAGTVQVPPGRLGDWQKLFARVYPIQQGESYGPAFARLAEELGELAEAVRVFRTQPGYFLSEASDVFAWLMRIQNLLDVEAGVSYHERGIALERTFAASYPDSCTDCGGRSCRCPDVLPSTIGRIGHEDPAVGNAADEYRFMTPDMRRRTFSPD